MKKLTKLKILCFLNFQKRRFKKFKKKKQKFKFQKSEIIGWIGTILIVGAYFLLSNNFFDSESLSYQTMNFFGALFLLYAAVKKKSSSLTALQIVWALIALIAIISIL